MKADQRNLLVVLGFLENLADQEDPARSQTHQYYHVMTIQQLSNNLWDLCKSVSYHSTLLISDLVIILMVSYLPALLLFQEPQIHQNLP